MSVFEDFRVVHLSYDGIQSAFQAQTVGLVRALCAHGVPAGMLVFTKPGTAQPFDSLESRANGSQIPFQVFLRPPLLGRANLWLALRQALPCIRELSRGGRRVILHCRGPLGTHIGLQLRDALSPSRIRVIADFRGLSVDEIKMLAGRRATAGRLRNLAAVVLSYRRAALAAELEAEACERADGLTCVSKALRTELALRYGIADDVASVVPTCTSFPFVKGKELEHRRAAAQQRLQLQGRFVVAYSGSMHPWQVPGDVVLAFRACRAARNDAHLLLLTLAPEVARSVLSSYEVPSDQFTLLELPHAEVQQALAAANAGLLLRRSSPVNRVASPIKFAEYLASGVPVIASKGIGDLDALIPAFGLGELIEDPAESGMALSRLHLDEEGAARVLGDDYSWDSAVSKLVALYRRAASGPGR